MYMNISMCSKQQKSTMIGIWGTFFFTLKTEIRIDFKNFKLNKIQ